MIEIDGKCVRNELLGLGRECEIERYVRDIECLCI